MSEAQDESAVSDHRQSLPLPPQSFPIHLPPMDSKSLAEQEKDIRDLLRRAERTPVKTSALVCPPPPFLPFFSPSSASSTHPPSTVRQRRDTLKRLIDLAHSSHPSLKIIAATNLKLFIRDFPDLEDDAINAVYDLCEDPVAGVRFSGLAAVVLHLNHILSGSHHRLCSYRRRFSGAEQMDQKKRGCPCPITAIRYVLLLVRLFPSS